MTREKRRYFRVPVDMPATVYFVKNRELRATATNLSEGGLAIQFSGKWPKESINKVQFTLPGTHTSLEAKATVAWADGSGRAGIRFDEVPQNSREHLDRWLSANISALEGLSPV
jgi:c-di-GMP-binding flagellar brake protein YcgR